MIAFVDFTEPVRKQILAHFPHLATPPPEGLDSPLPPPPHEGVPLIYPPSRITLQAQAEGGNLWTGLGTLVPVLGKPPEPLLRKEENLQPDIAEPVIQAREWVHSGIVDQGPSTENDNLLASIERSMSAELEDINDDEENESLFSNEDDAPSTDAAGHAQSFDAALDADRPLTWHDIALSIAASQMLKMRDEVKSRLGYTTSAVRIRYAWKELRI